MKKQKICTLLLVRHGQTSFNKEGRFYGLTDAPLTELGIKQANETAERLQDRQIDYIYASTLQRAIHTAQPLALQKELPITQDERLCEMNHGTWEGLQFEEARQLDPEKWNAWIAGEIPIPHGGETLEEGFERAKSWIDEIKSLEWEGSPTIAVFAHGGILQSFMCVLMNSKPQPLWQFHFQNGTIAEIDCHSNGNMLRSFEDKR